MRNVKKCATLSNDGLDDEVYLSYLENMGTEDFNNFDEAYSGSYVNDEEFAQDMAEQNGDIPRSREVAWPLYCIDWEFAAKKLMYDYTKSNGHYFRNL